MTTNGPATGRTLRVAAQVALNAPSIFNTQPWRWVVEEQSMQLWADRARQLLVADPDGRLLTVSCGAALHHAKVALAVAGHTADVQLMPDPAEPDLLAEVRIGPDHEPTSDERAAYAAISQRRTDRRAFTGEPVPVLVVQRLIALAEREGTHLAVLRGGEIDDLAILAARAAELQFADPAYRHELAAWTAAPNAPANGSGVPAETAVSPSPRRVPIREFAPPGLPTLDPGDGTDAGTLYAVLFSDEDGPAAWLRAGQALSALLLAATAAGLAGSPISDVTEHTLTRERLRHVLAGIGAPQLALRIGYPPAGTPPASPRRRLGEVVNLTG
ncbi:MAG: nitroreductase [Hamadaea sp.]|uniref:Acg family FMN-binding oxidoreductase n=1 Tax=Hamadaea sp. TaxID=2024425 RepID=UPI0018148C1C|nr:nitroreductase family protein [Hamadaea sp.]NUR74443.1 nitroreductase [Hamadaea sp.]NUT18951.1 nitroreductase [Hamadaea sp.]